MESLLIVVFQQGDIGAHVHNSLHLHNDNLFHLWELRFIVSPFCCHGAVGKNFRLRFLSLKKIAGIEHRSNGAGITTTQLYCHVWKLWWKANQATNINIKVDKMMQKWSTRISPKCRRKNEDSLLKITKIRFTQKSQKNFTQQKYASQHFLLLKISKLLCLI